MKFGKLPARPGAMKLRFKDIFNAAALPTPPAVFGHEALVSSWGMLANDNYGDCVWAGAAHEHMLWTTASEGAVPPASFTNADVLSDYSAATGFTASDPNSDQGTDMVVAASYRRKTGVVDSNGVRHIINAYLEVQTANFDELMLATYLFGVAGVGINCPSNVQDQFSAGQPWSVTPGTSIVGGHYIPCVGRAASGNAVCITWGKPQEMTPGFYQQYNDETVVYLCLEYMDPNKLTPEAFNSDALNQFLNELPAIAGVVSLLQPPD
jgi:hypothetical protein